MTRPAGTPARRRCTPARAPATPRRWRPVLPEVPGRVHGEYRYLATPGASMRTPCASVTCTRGQRWILEAGYRWYDQSRGGLLLRPVRVRQCAELHGSRQGTQHVPEPDVQRGRPESCPRSGGKFLQRSTVNLFLDYTQLRLRRLPRRPQGWCRAARSRSTGSTPRVTGCSYRAGSRRRGSGGSSAYPSACSIRSQRDAAPEPRVALVVGRHDRPRCKARVRERDHVPRRLLVLPHSRRLRQSSGIDLEALERIAVALLEARQLLLRADRHPELGDDDAVLGKFQLEFVDLGVGPLPVWPRSEAVHAFYQHAPVPGAVEDRVVATRRQLKPESPQVGGASSSGVGAEIGTTRYCRASSAAVMRRMAPPLPEASMPSNRVTTECRAKRWRRDRSASRPCSSSSSAVVILFRDRAPRLHRRGIPRAERRRSTARTAAGTVLPAVPPIRPSNRRAARGRPRARDAGGRCHR